MDKENYIDDLKKRMKSSQESVIHQLLISRIDGLADEVTHLALTNNSTWQEAIDEIKKSTHFMPPEYDSIVCAFRDLMINRVISTALSREITQKRKE